MGLNLKGACWGFWPTLRGLLVSHRKLLDPLLNGFLLTSLGKRAGRVSVSACSRPLRIHSNGAVFLKCAPSNPTAELAQTRRVRPSASSAPRHLRATHGWFHRPIGTGESPSPRNSRLISSPNRRRCFDRLAFKKTCPFEFTRHGRPWAGAETRPALLPSEVSQGEYQKGKYRFSGERSEPSRMGG
jgi:hypothetical protein